METECEFVDQINVALDRDLFREFPDRLRDYYLLKKDSVTLS
jgi:hypothetical protein